MRQWISRQRRRHVAPHTTSKAGLVYSPRRYPLAGPHTGSSSQSAPPRPNSGHSRQAQEYREPDVSTHPCRRADFASPPPLCLSVSLVSSHSCALIMPLYRPIFTGSSLPTRPPAHTVTNTPKRSHTTSCIATSTSYKGVSSAETSSRV